MPKFEKMPSVEELKEEASKQREFEELQRKTEVVDEDFRKTTMLLYKRDLETIKLLKQLIREKVSIKCNQPTVFYLMVKFTEKELDRFIDFCKNFPSEESAKTSPIIRELLKSGTGYVRKDHRYDVSPEVMAEYEDFLKNPEKYKKKDGTI